MKELIAKMLNFKIDMDPVENNLGYYNRNKIRTVEKDKMTNFMILIILKVMKVLIKKSQTSMVMNLFLKRELWKKQQLKKILIR